MRSLCFRALVVVLSLDMAGCIAGDPRLVADGIGTNLEYTSIDDQTVLQELYINQICRQAGGLDGVACSISWSTFVEAGMNDIDQRCDAYLSWLDQQRRSTGPILQQIGSTQNATQAILVATKVGTAAIGIVGAAFGFARDTFNNVNARFLLEVNHSTVQAVVLGSQTRFRSTLRGRVLTSRPQAIYALRQYLRICMPFTIENQINLTVVNFENGGPAALEDMVRRPLVGANAIGARPITPRMQTAPRRYSRETQTFETTRYSDLFTNDRSASYSAPYIKPVLKNLCSPPNEITDMDRAAISNIRARIKAYQQYLYANTSMALTGVTGALTLQEASKAVDRPLCNPALHKNIYEMERFQQGIAGNSDLIKIMNAVLNQTPPISQSATADQIRNRIPDLRRSLADKLVLRDPELDRQLTDDLFKAALAVFKTRPGAADGL
ncbi:hypothetical protein [Methylobacterium sp. Leaf469]|uniref:hypothetical protein n=1 Tax=Methylobacterium sp. Leaf469 TaxID=1736387 RepID=UPI000B32D450|nr:hypothetical protein [Methylobacterium sp. Leaf469]